MPAMVSILALLILCGRGAWAAGLIHDFEDEAPPGAFTVENGLLAISGDRCRSGHHSLAWDVPAGGSSLLYSSADALADGERRPVLAMWVCLQHPTAEVMQVQLLNGARVVARGWFGMNFRGWRPLGIRWADAGWRKDIPVDGVRLILNDAGAWGRVYIDRFCADAAVNGLVADDQQPWAGGTPDRVQPERVFHTGLDLAFNRAWLPALKGSDELTDADRAAMRALVRPAPVVAADDESAVERLTERVRRDYELHERAGGVIGRGLAAGGFWDPTDGLPVEAFLRTLEAVAAHPQLRALHAEMVRHLLDQGFASGSGNVGALRDERFFKDGRLARIMLASAKELERCGRLQEAVDSVIWLALGGDELREHPAVAGRDRSERLTTAMLAVGELPESPQKLQRLQVLQRYGRQITP